MEINLLCNQETTMAEKRIFINGGLFLASIFRKTFENYWKYDRVMQMLISSPHLTSQMADTFKRLCNSGPQFRSCGRITQSRFLVDFLAYSRRFP